MSRRLARAGRLGQRSTGQGKPWSPAAIPNLEGWWSADDALASVGPDVPAVPGDRIRSVPDRSRHKRSMDQTTGNRQPMLGYLRPPKGNYSRGSDSFKVPGNPYGWGGIAAGHTEETELLDPLGNKVTAISADYDFPDTRKVWRQDTLIPSGVPEADRSVTLWVWARTANPGSQPIWLTSPWNQRRYVIEGTEWQLLSADTTMHAADRRIHIHFDNSHLTEKITDTVYIGTIYVTHQTWSDEFVPVGTERSIPDTTDLQRAMVFDGVVGNQLITTEELGGSTEVTIVTVHGVNPAAGKAEAVIFSSNNRNYGTPGFKVRDDSSRHVTIWGIAGYDVRTGPLPYVRDSYLDTYVLDHEGVNVFRNAGKEFQETETEAVDDAVNALFNIGMERIISTVSYSNGPITDILYFTRALSDAEIQRVEDYFLIKSGINRIVTEESEVKELETVKALAPGIWYLDGEPLNEEPLQKIEVPFGSAGKQLTVGDSYGIEVLP